MADIQYFYHCPFCAKKYKRPSAIAGHLDNYHPNHGLTSLEAAPKMGRKEKNEWSRNILGQLKKSVDFHEEKKRKKSSLRESMAADLGPYSDEEEEEEEEVLNEPRKPVQHKRKSVVMEEAPVTYMTLEQFNGAMEEYMKKKFFCDKE